MRWTGCDSIRCWRLQIILTLVFLLLVSAGVVTRYCLGRAIDLRVSQQRELQRQHQVLNNSFPLIQNALATGIPPNQAEINARKARHEELVSNMMDTLGPAVVEQQWRSATAVAMVCVLLIQIAAQIFMHVVHHRRSAHRGTIPTRS